MSRNNDMFRVLVTTGNQGLAAKDSLVTGLAPGQLGIFDAKTGKAVDVTNAASAKKFFFAVGVDADGDTVTDDVIKSAGIEIQKKNIVAFDKQPYAAGRPMKVVLKDYVAECDTEYGVKLNLSNQEIYRTQGYIQFAKTYTLKTACCNGCEETCPSGDANEITKQLLINVANDPSGLVTGKALARQEITGVTGISGTIAAGAEVTLAQIDFIMTHNANLADVGDYLYTDIEFTTVTQAIKKFCSVNLMYFNSRETVISLTKIEGFACTGTIEVTQTPKFEQGSGYDLMQKEYLAEGWINSPYRTSALIGLARPIAYNAVATANYTVYSLTYDYYSEGAWLEYHDNQATIIGVPDASTTTKNAIDAIMAIILA